MRADLRFVTRRGEPRDWQRLLEVALTQKVCLSGGGGGSVGRGGGVLKLSGF